MKKSLIACIFAMGMAYAHHSMEGFDRAQYDQILGLSSQGLATAVVAAVGYRSPSDKYSQAPKVRFPKNEVFVKV